MSASKANAVKPTSKVFLPNTNRQVQLKIKKNGEYILNPLVRKALLKNPSSINLPSGVAWDKKKKKLIDLYEGKQHSTEFKNLSKTARKSLQYYGDTMYDRNTNKIVRAKNVYMEDGTLRKKYVDRKILSSGQIAEGKRTPRDVHYSFSFSYYLKHKNKGIGKKETETFEVLAKQSTPIQRVQQKANEHWNKRIKELNKSPFVVVGTKQYPTTRPKMTGKVLVKTAKPMKQKKANSINYLHIEGTEKDVSWDTKSERCVYDWIIHNYSQHSSKICNYETLWYIFNSKRLNLKTFDKINNKEINYMKSVFNEYYKTEKEVEELLEKMKDPYEDWVIVEMEGEIVWGCGEQKELLPDELADNVIKTYADYKRKFWGVSPEQMDTFCKYMRIPHYGLDKRYNFIVYSYPENKRDKAPALTYIFTNNHIYPITESKMIRSVAQKGSELTQRPNFKVKEEKEEKKKIETIDVFNCDNKFKFLVDIMKQTGTQIIEKKVSFIGTQLFSFEVGGTKYVFVENMGETKNYARILYEKNGEEYNGQTLMTIANKQLKEIKLKKGKHNFVVNQLLHTKGVKFRQHLGFVNKSLVIDEDCKAFDIVKCYSKCITSPFEKFIIFNYNSTPKEYNGEEIVVGLYYIQTDDTLLFHKSNIYSTSIVKKGLEEKIITKENIKWVIECESPQPRNLFIPLFEKYKELCGEHTDICKLLNNLTTGLMGQSNMCKKTLNCSLDVEEAYNYLIEHPNENCYLRQEENITFYGLTNITEREEHNIPIYIQILDDSNIRLYNLMKEATNNKLENVLYRKTDMVVVRDAERIKLGNKWGEYRKEDLPTKYLTSDYNNRTPELQHPQFEYNYTRRETESGDFENIYKLLNLNGGLMLNGSAGTGKSYVIRKVAELFNNEVAKICFTNKGAINIGGQTIHRFLGLNEDNKIPPSKINTIKKYLRCIIIDEVSMVPSEIWGILHYIYRETKVPFLLVGDWKQIPPVEDLKECDYLHHPIVFDLARGNLVELTKVYRYDMELKRASENVMELDTSKYSTNTNDRHISYTNMTRKYVNRITADRIFEETKPKNFIQIKEMKLTKRENESKEDFDERCSKNPTQNIKIFRGTPIIARKTINKGEYCVNNEEFIIVGLGKTEYEEGGYEPTIFARATRPDGEHEISIYEKDFNFKFLPAYCITTHKAQGTTIDERFTIWDWDKMDKRLRYTAITRATKNENISFGKTPSWKTIKKVIEK